MGSVVGGVVGVVMGDEDCAETSVVRNVAKRRIRRLVDDVPRRREVAMIGKRGEGMCVC